MKKKNNSLLYKKRLAILDLCKKIVVKTISEFIRASMPKIKIDNGKIISSPKKLICASILVGILSPIKYEFSLKKLDPAPILNRVDLRDIHFLISKVIEEILKCSSPFKSTR